MAALITTSEFNKKMRAWAFAVKNKATQILTVSTHSTGELNNSIRFKQKFHKGETGRIAFEFVKHGVFLQYGAGRGYIVKNGVIVRGHRATDAQVSLLMQRGYTRKEAKSMKYESFSHRLDTTIKRKKVDWINGPVKENIKELADICGEYHGDRTMQYVLDHFDKLMIGGKPGVKNNTTVYVKG